MRGSLAVLALAVLSAALAIAADPPSDQIEVHGVVLDEVGKPAAGATIKAISEPFVQPSTKTDAKGRFALQVDRKRSLNLRLLASDASGRQQAMFSHDGNKPQALKDSIEIKLGKTREIKVTVVDEKEQPIAGASAVAVASYSKLDEQPTDAKGQATLVVPAGVPLQYVYALKPKVGLDYYFFRQAYSGDQTNPYWLEQDHARPLQFTLSGIQPVTVRVLDDGDRPLSGVRVAPWYIDIAKKGGDLNTIWTSGLTNDDGEVKFDTIPSNNLTKITIWAYKDRYSSPQRWMFDPAGSTSILAVKLIPQVRVSGKVSFPDGKPAAGATVSFYGAGYSHDRFREEAICNAQGEFEKFVDPNQFYAVIARSERLASKAETQAIVAGRDAPELSLKLLPATRVHGVLRDRKGQEPLAGKDLQLYQEHLDKPYRLLPEKEKLPNPGDERTSIDPLPSQSTLTDEQGRFEFFAGPGSYYIVGSVIGQGAPHFDVDGQKELELNLESARPPATAFRGKVVLKADAKRTVAAAPINGLPLEYDPDLREFGATTLADGSFKGQRSPAEMVLVARSADQLLGGVVKVGADAEEATIALEPTVTVRGRLIDDETGKPLPEQQVDYSFEVRYPKRDDGQPSISSTRYSYGNLFGSTTTDAGGNFVLSGLVVGGTYQLQMVSKRGPDGLPREHAMLSSIVPEKSITDLGNVKLIKPKEFKPPTLDELIDRAMTPKPVYEQGRLSTPSLEDRLKVKLHDAKLAEQQVLAIIVPKKSSVCRQFYARYFGHDDPERENPERRAKFFKFVGNYALLAVDATDGKPLDSARETLASLKIPLPEEDGGTFAVLDQEGKLIAAAASGDLLDKDEHLDIEKLLEFVNKHARALPDAEKLLSDALAQAKRDDKRVLVQVSGAFCAPCVLLSRYLDEHKDLIAKDYVVVKLDDRFVSGPETIKRVRTEEGGIPWTVILDATGKQLVTSTAKSGNIGFPSTPEGIEHFEKMLSSTAQRLTKDEIGKLMEALGDSSPPR